jgi:hypothetical protein
MKTLKLDGRDFVGISQALTAAQDDYIIGHLRAAGARQPLAALLAATTEIDKAEAGEALLTQIMISGRLHAVMAGVLTEVGKKWTFAEAERNTAVFRDLTDQDEKVALRQELMFFVANFIRFGGRSLPSSANSSSQHAKDRPTARAGRKTSATSTS